MMWDPIAAEVTWVELLSWCSHTGFGQESLFLLSCQKREKPNHGLQQHVGVSAFETCSGQEIRTDHLQTVASRFVGAQHLGCNLDSLLDDGNLALVQLEIR